MGTEIQNQDFELFSSLRYDRALFDSKSNTDCCGHATSFYMLPYHRDRMLEAAIFFDWPEAVFILSSLKTFEDRLSTAVTSYNNEHNQNGNPLKVRVSIGPTSSELKVQLSPVPPVSLETLFPSSLPPTSGNNGNQAPWNVHIYRDAINTNAHTTFKTTQRVMYDRARKNFGLDNHTSPPTEEVLLLDSQGNLLEGSATSVYFNHDGKWVTPPAGLDHISVNEKKWKGGQQGTSRRWALEAQLCTEGSVPISAVREANACVVSNGVRGFIEGRIAKSINSEPR